MDVLNPSGPKLAAALIIVLFELQFSTAESIYIAQSASGENTGVDTANTHAATWINSTESWGVGPLKIGPGDSVHLCGIITTPLRLLGSGTAGNPITIYFERNARLSRPHWEQGGDNYDAAISANKNSNLIIDGGANGLIECTDNGTMKSYQVESRGISMYQCSFITVRDLQVLNIYLRVASPTDAGFGSAIYFRGSNNITIMNNVVNDAERPIDITFDQGDHDYEISGNSSVNAGEGNIVLGSSNSGATITGVRIHHNSFSKGKGTWSGNPDIHTNCMHLFAVHDNTRIDSIRIYNNRVTGDWAGNSTSYIFLEGNVFDPMVYNNIFIAGDPGSEGGNAYLYVKRSPGYARVFNNTFIGNGGGMNGIMVDGKGSTVMNNLFYNVISPVVCPYDTTGLTICDYNNYYQGTIFCFGSYSQMSFAAWKSRKGFDQHTTTAKPLLDTCFAPTSADTAIHGKGVNLYDYCTRDFYDHQLAPTGPWDMGAVRSTDGSVFVPPGTPSQMIKTARMASTNAQLRLSGTIALRTMQVTVTHTLSGRKIGNNPGVSMIGLQKARPMR